MNDPYVLLAIQCYKREPVTLKQLARMLGIGEKAFSKIVKLNVARRGDSETRNVACDDKQVASGTALGSQTEQWVLNQTHRAGVAPCRHIQFHTTPSVAGRTEL